MTHKDTQVNIPISLEYKKLPSSLLRSSQIPNNSKHAKQAANVGRHTKLCLSKHLKIKPNLSPSALFKFHTF